MFDLRRYIPVNDFSTMSGWAVLSELVQSKDKSVLLKDTMQ